MKQFTNIYSLSKTLRFELNTDHAYSVLQNSTFRVNGTKQIKLTSRHTYSQFNEIDIELNLGIFFEVNSNISAIIFIEGFGG